MMMLQLLQVMTFVLSIIINGNLVFMSHGYYYGSPYCGYYNGSYINTSCVDYGLPIHSPFWISSGFGNPDYLRCKAYPGFEVRCESGTKPAMNISNHLYYVQGIDSDFQRITLMDVDVDGEECPRPRHNFSLQSQPFLDYGYSDSQIQQKLTLFYNCTIAPSSTAGTARVEEIPCLENSYNNKTRRSYAFPPYDYGYNNSASYPVPEGFDDWYNYCEESVAVPVEDYDYTTNNATAVLQRPFTLLWSYPVDCDDCEGSSGQCSANHTTGGGIRCQCKDGKTVENDYCQEQVPQVPQGAPFLQVPQGAPEAPQDPQGAQGVPDPQAPQGTQARQ